MRLRKGSKVEVVNKKEIPVSWRTAEILSGNGHTYTVQYDYLPVMDSGSLMEKVSRKLVRPLPPTLIGEQTWEVGDTIEVFQNLSWKIATILKVMPGDLYMVRLSGCCMESTVQKSNTRDELLWLGDKWILMGKGSGACEVEQVSNLPSSKYCPKKVSDAKRQRKPQIHSSRVTKKRLLKESAKVFSRSLKRVPPCWSSVCESHAGNPHNCRALEKDRSRPRMTTPFGVRKIDAAPYLRNALGELHIDTLLEDRTIRYIEPKSGKFNCSAALNAHGSFEPRHSDSVSSSVGSCSAVSVGQNGFNTFLRGSFQGSDNLCRDAESMSEDDEEMCFLSSSKGEVPVSIHEMELDAYRSTLKVLHASGPLSWEQESMLTNLRITLHVSNDEHLMEIRYLLSDQSGASCR